MTPYIFASVLMVMCVKWGLAIENYCSENTFNVDENSSGMQFTKEASNKEFAVVDNFKALHCCAKGYKSIEWFKDGRPYPWDLDLSSLIIFPESANQTIYTKATKNEDSGNYTCVLRNVKGNITEMYSHAINLEVFAKAPDDLKITYVSDDKEAYADDIVRLFCEAFSGTIDLPDAHSEAIWYKQFSNGTRIDSPERIVQAKTSREKGQTFGTYLSFNGMEADDYGTYICVITRPANTIERKVTIREKLRVVEYINPNPFPLEEVLIISFMSVVFITTILVLIKQYGLRLRVMLKDSYGSLEENDGKTSDVLVTYAAKDFELAVGVLVPNLEAKGYQCLTKELTDNIPDWSQQLTQQAQSSRRIIILLSPAALNDSWSSGGLYQALKELQNIVTPKLITIALKELPLNQNDTKNSLGETLASVSKAMNVIVWERSRDNHFWLNICKELPAKRGPTNRPRLTSQSSIDNLMVV